MESCLDNYYSRFHKGRKLIECVCLCVFTDIGYSLCVYVCDTENNIYSILCYEKRYIEWAYMIVVVVHQGGLNTGETEASG